MNTPPRIVIPSADFGGPILSVFDPAWWRDDNPLLDIDAEGCPVTEMDAIAAVHAVAEQLYEASKRDMEARYWPNERYAAPRSMERWLQLIDQSLDDLNWARLRIAREIEAG